MENVEQLPLTLEKAVQLVKDVFISAAERDVYTGDALKICIITKEGIREELVPLRKDWDVFSAMPKLACFFFFFLSPVASFLHSAVLFIFLLENKYVNSIRIVCPLSFNSVFCQFESWKLVSKNHWRIHDRMLIVPMYWVLVFSDIWLLLAVITWAKFLQFSSQVLPVSESLWGLWLGVSSDTNLLSERALQSEFTRSD